MAPNPVWSESPDAIRDRFLEFFRKRGHEVLPSASLVPENDPSLLFIGAGMAPFKDHFLGRVPLTFRRAATSQKCLRTGDLENVGRTPGHHTFFEMLGNFSFGDYFKDKAIEWAWEFLTVEMGIPGERLRVTVYRDDEEAAGLWTKVAGVPPDRIGRLGAKSNFWPANAPEDGPDGPCGPCSEIFFDLGFKPDPKAACSVKGCPESPESPDCDCQRFLEVWNLVFQQYERKGKDNLVPLAMKNIDTGMGFERLLTVLAHLAEGKTFGERGIYFNFDTALFRPMTDFIAKDAQLCSSGEEFKAHPLMLVKVQRVCDHARASVFCLGDGIRPDRVRAGYVLRKVIRRAVRDLISIGIPDPFLHKLVPVIANVMGTQYPEIRQHASQIGALLVQEEERFRENCQKGIQLLERRGAELMATSSGVFPGEILFVLYDTYGFPPETVADILREKGFEPDLKRFEVLMEEQRKRSREGSKMATDIFAAGPLERVKKEHEATVFLGYGPKPEKPDGTYDWDPGVEASSTVVEILVGEKPADRMEAGQEGALLLKETPFYAEQGGQVGDSGEIRGPGGAIFRVSDTKKVEGFHLHLGRLENGPLALGAAVTAVVDRARRDSIRRNHTGTHLLHRVLKKVLGEDARQAGSLVAPDYLRFDFSWPKGLSPEDRERIESEVNRRIRENHPVRTRVYGIDEARATGAVSMFGEKYGSRVRVLTAGDSKEFCGGTHCRATGDIQEFRIVTEKSIGSGVRRIEAVTGTEAVAALEENRRRAAAQEEESRRRREEERHARRQLFAEFKPVEVKGGPWSGSLKDPLPQGSVLGGVLEFVAIYDGAPEGQLQALGDLVKVAEGPPYAALATSHSGEEVLIVAAGNPAAVKAGFKAGAAVGVVAKALGGGGGGRPDFARGKGKDPTRIPEAVAAFEAYLAGLAK